MAGRDGTKAGESLPDGGPQGPGRSPEARVVERREALLSDRKERRDATVSRAASSRGRSGVRSQGPRVSRRSAPSTLEARLCDERRTRRRAKNTGGGALAKP